MEDRLMRTRWFIVLVGALAALGRSGSAQEPQVAQHLRQALQLSDAGRNLSPAEIDRIVRGYLITPVLLDLRGKDPVLVGLGSYNVNAKGGCNDCHTAPPYTPDGDPFAGAPKRINAARYLAGGVPFGPPGDPNTPVSRNLTPRATTGLPAGLTWEQFRRTMRTGADLKHRPPFAPSETNDLLQVMPWPVFQDMTERDLRAIYEYLRAIPSLPSTP
jgi:hypothetical protein